MLVLPVLVSPRRMTLKVRLPMVDEVIDMDYLNNIKHLCRNSKIINCSLLQPSLRFRQTHLGYLRTVGVALSHVFVVFLLEGAGLLVLHRLGRHIFLLQLLCYSIVRFLFLVVEFVEVDLNE